MSTVNVLSTEIRSGDQIVSRPGFVYTVAKAQKVGPVVQLTLKDEGSGDVIRANVPVTARLAKVEGQVDGA